MLLEEAANIISLLADPLDNFSCQYQNVAMKDLAVIEEPATARVMLDPTRARILATLAEPGSATTVADSIGLSRLSPQGAGGPRSRSAPRRAAQTGPHRAHHDRLCTLIRSFAVGPGPKRPRPEPHRSAIGHLPHRPRRATAARGCRPGPPRRES